MIKWNLLFSISRQPWKHDSALIKLQNGWSWKTSSCIFRSQFSMAHIKICSTLKMVAWRRRRIGCMTALLANTIGFLSLDSFFSYPGDEKSFCWERWRASLWNDFVCMAEKLYNKLLVSSYIFSLLLCRLNNAMSFRCESSCCNFDIDGSFQLPFAPPCHREAAFVSETKPKPSTAQNIYILSFFNMSSSTKDACCGGWRGKQKRTLKENLHFSRNARWKERNFPYRFLVWRASKKKRHFFSIL